MADRTPLDVLMAARERIADPAHWCQGSYAQIASGESINSRDPEAVRWCAVGALNAEKAHTTALLAAGTALTDAAHVVYGTDLTVVNDIRGHAAVLAAYDAAIASVEAQP